jgi:hypothetical protein
MKRFRQLIRSIRENGGSWSTLWPANSTRSRRDLAIRYPPASFVKNFRRRSGWMLATAAAVYTPARAHP